MNHASIITQKTKETTQAGRKATVRISEIFGPTIQGEGAHIGKPTIFVRTGGCDFHCSWCDTMYAVDTRYKDEWQDMSCEGIFDEVKKLAHHKPLLVTLSGGNPALQPLGHLLMLGHMENYTFTMETQGSVVSPWMRCLDFMTVSPKPPSSGMPTKWERVKMCLDMLPTGRTSLKIVIKDEEDYHYARSVAEHFPFVPLYLQPCNPTPGLSEDTMLENLDALIERVIHDTWYDVTVLPQLHVLLWGNTRGV